MQSLKHAVSQFVSRGRIGRKKSFAAAVIAALMVMPVVTALAYFSATGSGTVSNVQAGTSASTVSITSGALAYSSTPDAAGSGTNLVPGGSVVIPLTITCTAGAPCQVPSLTLGSWSSNKTGCDPTTMPNSFAISTVFGTLGLPKSISALNGTITGSIAVNWANLSTPQDACQGAVFAFNLQVP